MQKKYQAPEKLQKTPCCEEYFSPWILLAQEVLSWDVISVCFDPDHCVRQQWLQAPYRWAASPWTQRVVQEGGQEVCRGLRALRKHQSVRNPQMERAGRPRRALRKRRTLVPGARFCLLSIEAFSQGARFSADGVKLPSRAAEGLQPPAWVRPHLLPLPSASLSNSHLGGSFSFSSFSPNYCPTVSRVLLHSSPYPSRASPSWPPACSRASGTLSAWAMATCQTWEPSCGLDAVPAPSVTWSLLPAAHFSPYLPPEPLLLEGRYWDSLLLARNTVADKGS